MYSQAFYGRRQKQKELAARAAFDLILPYLPPVTRAVDVGCGIGIWLSELKSRGVEVLGFDGPWVDETRLLIPQTSFRRADLAQPFPTDTRFDLAMSLEVAEHLPPDVAGAFVDHLTRLAPVVLFSAAIPGQGGTGHINEQWPDYWAELFAARGYRLADIVRPALWNVAEIPYWYRQNTFIYVSESALAGAPKALAQAVEAGPTQPMRTVHPVLFEEKRRGPLLSFLQKALAAGRVAPTT